MSTRKLARVLAPTAASKQEFLFTSRSQKHRREMVLRRLITRAPKVMCSYRLFLLITIFTAVGCGSIAVPPQPDVDRREIERTPPVERTPDGRDSAKVEIIGTVERVDKIKNEIQLRTTEAKVIVIKYDPATLVYSREQQVGIEALRPRDLILVRVAKTSQGEQHADLIRLNDRKE